MRIVVAGGREEADFLIGSLLAKKHEVKVINKDTNYSKYLADKYNVIVLNGDPTKEYILEDAEIYDYDVLIALTNDDADNFVTCLVAKKNFNIKRIVCTVNNPTNVEIFKKLGVNNVISSTYSVARLIEQATTLESLVNTLSSEDEAFSISEIVLQDNSAICEKPLKLIKLPDQARITCVIRRGKMTIPTGQTVLHSGDKVLLLSAKDCHKKAIEIISGGMSVEE